MLTTARHAAHELSVVRRGPTSYAPRHDWFAEVAEDYVRYIFSRCRGFEVFGGGKGTADLAIFEPATGRMLRVEVRSTDRSGKKPRRKGATRLAQTADLLAEVTLEAPGRLGIKLFRLDARGHRVAGQTLARDELDRLDEWLHNVAGAQDDEATEWSRFGLFHLARAYADDEPAYTKADVKPEVKR